MKKIHVGFLLSYDYELLKYSIPPVYSASDAIFIAVDKNFKTWSGGEFEVAQSFYDWIDEIDVQKKISFYRDDFYDPGLNAMENEIKERKKLASKMGIGNWLVQVDSDEYFLDFKKFTKDLKSYDHFLEDPEKNPVQIACFQINLYKYVDGGVLYVDEVRRQKMATNYPDYRTGRNTGQRVIYTKNLMLHESVSRTENEILKKLTNWGHSHQVDPEKFIKKWRAVNKSNYKDFQDLFYLTPSVWKKLDFAKGNTVWEINKNLDQALLMPSDYFIWKKNFGQWFKFLWK